MVGLHRRRDHGREAQPDTLIRVTTTPQPTTRRAARVAAGVLVVQALAIFGFTVFYLVELVRGATGNSSRAVMSMVLFVIAIAFLGLLAWGLWHGLRWARTPAVVWLALLLPVAWGMFQSGVALIGALVLLTAVVGIAATVLSGRETA